MLNLIGWCLFDAQEKWWTEKRKPAIYATVMVVNGHFENGQKKFYWMIEGEVILAKVNKRNGTIESFSPCRLTNSNITYSRRINAKDCIIL